MGARWALCLPLLMLATPSDLSAQVRDPWREKTMASTQSSVRDAPPPPAPVASATIASIALSMKSRPHSDASVERAIQDSRCYLMNGGAVESFFISEDTPVGSIIGSLSVNGDPRDDLGDVTLRVQEKGAAVGLAPGSKNLTLLRALDREEKQGPSNVYVNVRCDRRRTTDPSFIIPVSVRVWDVNDNAPQWVGAPYRVRVSELTAVGTRILAPRATDADQPGPHATLHYSVVPGPQSELVRFAHELESVVVVGSPLDYESFRNFTVTLRAADAGSPPLRADAELIVELLDADDQNPAFSHEHYTAVIPDESLKDTILVTSPGPISAADQDLGINAPLFYTTSGDNKHLVAINRDTGHVTVTEQLLAITQPVTIVLKATQVDNADRYALATLSVSRRAGGAGHAGGGAGGAGGGVRFARARFHCRVSEAAAPGALLATLQTEPPSHHNPLQFFVSDRSFLDKFAINGAGEVLLRRSLDYETADSYYYQVMVTDGISNDTASLNITVTNVNEWEPRFRFPQYEFSVDPPLAEGDDPDSMERVNRMGLLPVGKLDVFDGDKADTVTLSLRGPDASMLYINASGEMFLRQEALAQLNTSVLHVVATAADSGDPPRQTSVPVLVHVSSKLLRAQSSITTTPILAAGGAAIALLAMLLCAALLLLRRSRRSKPSPAPASKPYTAHDKPRSPPAASPPALPPASPLAVGTSGSLQSVSAGASTILANSSSSLDLRDSLPPNGTVNGGGLRGSRGKAAPLPPPEGAGAAVTGSGLSLMSDHLAAGPGGGGGRSGVAWPSSTIPARVKKLSWDDAAPADDKDSGVVQAANTARHDHMNLTVYF